MMDEKLAAYEVEAKYQRDTYGPGAEIPSDPYGQVRGSLRDQRAVPQTPRPNMLGAPALPRLSQLTSQLAEAGQALGDARDGYALASERKSKCELNFAQIADALMKLIHELREGTPEGVSYRS